jgi:hypothetical protein
MYAHRWAYEHFHGPIPGLLNVLHRCDNPPCVNPAHLFLGSQLDNLEDCREKSRLGYEPRGGSSQYVGVCFVSSRSDWMAYLCHRRRRITIGRFATEREAAAARDAYILGNDLPHQLNLSQR